MTRWILIYGGMVLGLAGITLLAGWNIYVWAGVFISVVVVLFGVMGYYGMKDL